MLMRTRPIVSGYQAKSHARDPNGRPASPRRILTFPASALPFRAAHEPGLIHDFSASGSLRNSDAAGAARAEDDAASHVQGRHQARDTVAGAVRAGGLHGGG